MIPRPLAVCLVAVMCAFCAASSLAQDVFLTPQRVIEFATLSNTAVLNARYMTESELLNLSAAAARFKPSLRLRSTLTHLGEAPSVTLDPAALGLPAGMPARTIEMAPQDVFSVGYTISQPIFAGGRLLNNYRAARSRYETTLQDSTRVSQVVRLAAVRLYWGYVAAWQRIKPIEETIAWLEQLTKDMTAMVEAGVAIEDDKLRMKTQLSLAQLQYMMAGDTLADIADQLLVFCNLSPQSNIMVDTLVLVSIERDSTPADCDIEQVVAQRADIRALELGISTLETVRRAQRAAYLPTLGAAFTQEIKNQTASDPTEFDNVWSVSAALDWNLIDWGAARSERSRTAVSVSQAKLALDARRRAVRAEVMSAQRKVGASLEGQRLALETVDNALRAMRNADSRYRAGLITGTDLLARRKELTEAQLALISARIRKALAIEELKAATGGM